MQRFIKNMTYGIAAVALTIVTVNTAEAQRGGGSRGGNGGGRAPAMGGGFKGGSGGNFKGMPNQNHITKNSNPTFKPQGSFDHKPNHQVNNKPKFDHKPMNGGKFQQPTKGFAKGEPHPSAPGGFKHPGKFDHKFGGKFYKDFCGTPFGGKYSPYCNNWKGCYPNWGFCGNWNGGCYPSWGGNYCWPKHCYYPVNYCYPTSYCFTTYTPVYYVQPVCVPTVVQEFIQAPVQPVVSTTVAQTTTQAVTQTAATAPAGGMDFSFLTNGVFNQ